MSEDEGVMPFQMICEVIPLRVTPVSGKGALGTRRSSMRIRNQTLCWMNCGDRILTKVQYNYWISGCRVYQH